MHMQGISCLHDEWMADGWDREAQTEKYSHSCNGAIFSDMLTHLVQHTFWIFSWWPLQKPYLQSTGQKHPGQPSEFSHNYDGRIQV